MMKHCVDCRHKRPWPSAWILLIPVAGWVMFLVTRMSDESMQLGKCAVSFKDDYDFLGVQGETKFMINARRYGPCGQDAKFFETI